MGTATKSTFTKKDLIDRITQTTGCKRILVKRLVQECFLQMILELGRGNRLEFREFGIFEARQRRARLAQNPKTLVPVAVPAKRTVRFKVGRLMRKGLDHPESFLANIDAARLADEADGHADGDGAAAPILPNGDGHAPRPKVTIPKRTARARKR